jgi:CspA family cold shock protein
MSIAGDAAVGGGGAVVTGTVAWFDVVKQFGFVALSNGCGDAFLHMSVLKEAGYVWIPRSTVPPAPHLQLVPMAGPEAPLCQSPVDCKEYIGG